MWKLKRNLTPLVLRLKFACLVAVFAKRWRFNSYVNRMSRYWNHYMLLDMGCLVELQHFYHSLLEVHGTLNILNLCSFYAKIRRCWIFSGFKSWLFAFSVSRSCPTILLQFQPQLSLSYLQAIFCWMKG